MASIEKAAQRLIDRWPDDQSHDSPLYDEAEALRDALAAKREETRDEQMDREWFLGFGIAAAWIARLDPSMARNLIAENGFDLNHFMNLDMNDFDMKPLLDLYEEAA